MSRLMTRSWGQRYLTSPLKQQHLWGSWEPTRNLPGALKWRALAKLRAAPMRLPLTLPATFRRGEKNRGVLRPFSIAMVAVLLMHASYAHAQHGSPPSSQSPKEKAKAEEKRA